MTTNRLLYLSIILILAVTGLGITHLSSSHSFNQSPTIIYVNGSSEGGDGKAWLSAVNSIQQALDMAGPNTEIWVAKGIYYPEKLSDENDTRSKTFQLKNNVRLIGGFAGNEKQITDRNWKVNKTILNGDLENDDSSENYDDNVYHVVTGSEVDSTAVIDGFTITGGNANADEWPNDGGGGMTNEDGSPTILNCLFEKNRSFADGGGMRTWGDSRPLVMNSHFNENQSVQEGGGMMNGPGSQTIVINCVFTNNYSGEDGGGMYNNETENQIIANCLFTNNRVGLTGGGMYNVNWSKPLVVNCTFTGNTADEAGGAVSNRDSDPTIVNSILWSNKAVSNNEVNNLRSSPSISRSIVQGGTSGNEIMEDDPLFTDEFNLSKGSSAIDKGKSEIIPKFIQLDLIGNPRINGESIDLGAYEFKP